MKKHLILIILSTVLFVQKSNSQVSNLSELLDLSELPEFVLTKYLEVNWELHQPTEIIENGRATSTHTFTYNYNQKKQVLKRVINMDLDTAYKIRSTIFISDDLFFLERIEKSLIAKEFFEVGNEDGKKLYEDGNRMLFIERDFHKKAKDLYKITVMYKDDFILHTEKSTNNKSENLISSDNVRVNQKWNIKGIENDDLGTFNLKVYEDWSCDVELNIKGKSYKSIKCNSSEETALLVWKKDTLNIEFSTPEFIDANIDILGNKISFDYISTSDINSFSKENLNLEKANKSLETINEYGNSIQKIVNDRKVIFKPKISRSKCLEKGEVILIVKINSEGEVVTANATVKSGNISSCLIQNAIQLARKHRWNKVNKKEIDIIYLTLNFEK